MIDFSISFCYNDVMKTNYSLVKFITTGNYYIINTDNSGVVSLFLRRSKPNTLVWKTDERIPASYFSNETCIIIISKRNISLENFKELCLLEVL